MDALDPISVTSGCHPGPSSNVTPAFSRPSRIASASSNRALRATPEARQAGPPHRGRHPRDRIGREVAQIEALLGRHAGVIEAENADDGLHCPGDCCHIAALVEEAIAVANEIEEQRDGQRRAESSSITSRKRAMATGSGSPGEARSRKRCSRSSASSDSARARRSIRSETDSGHQEEKPQGTATVFLGDGRQVDQDPGRLRHLLPPRLTMPLCSQYLTKVLPEAPSLWAISFS